MLGIKKGTFRNPIGNHLSSWPGENCWLFRVCNCNRAHICMKCHSKKHSAKECSRYVRAPNLTTIGRFWNAPKQRYKQVIRMTDPQGCDQGPNKTTWIFLLKHVPAIFSERMSLQCSGLLGILNIICESNMYGILLYMFTSFKVEVWNMALKIILCLLLFYLSDSKA